MKHELIKKINELDSEFESSFRKYIGDTENKSQRYKDLLKDNEKSSEDINKMQRRIN